MTFSEFANKLYSVIGGGSSQYAFTKTILEMMLKSDNPEILEGTSKRAFGSYFSGERSIHNLAAKMLPYLDGYDFTEMLTGYSDASLEELCRIFEDELGECNVLQIAQQLQDLFKNILIEAAAEKKRQKKKSPQDASPEGSDKDCSDTTESDQLTDYLLDDRDGGKKTSQDGYLIQIAKVIQNGNNSVYLENNGTINLNW